MVDNQRKGWMRKLRIREPLSPEPEFSLSTPDPLALTEPAGLPSLWEMRVKQKKVLNCQPPSTRLKAPMFTLKTRWWCLRQTVPIGTGKLQQNNTWIDWFDETDFKKVPGRLSQLELVLYVALKRRPCWSFLLKTETDPEGWVCIYRAKSTSFTHASCGTANHTEAAVKQQHKSE